MDRQKKKILLAILVVAFIQMPGLALTPGINQIRQVAFSEYSLGAVQTALAVSALAQPVAAFGAALLINRRLVTKKVVILLGLVLLAITGGLAFVANTEFWHLIMLSILLGASTGFFMSNMFGLISDNFDTAERQAIMGWQTSIINAGGIMMSLMGGLLAGYIWYGGYSMLLVGLPAAVLVAFMVPNYKAPATDGTGESVASTINSADAAGNRDAVDAAGTMGAIDDASTVSTTDGISSAGNKKARSGLDPRIYYYCAAACLFFMTYSVCGSNLSTHISGLGNTGTAGIAVAFQMGGGVVSGLFFGKLSKKIGDYSLSVALGLVFVGYMLLSLFPSSLALVFGSVFIVGMALSIMLPRCIFMVSTLAVDKSTSATATALISVVSPSAGGFLSPIVFTNVTTALFGNSTTARYRFVGFFVLAVAIAVAVVTASRGNKAPGLKADSPQSA